MAVLSTLPADDEAMPELPEVETICRGLRPHLQDRRILRVEVLQPRLRLPVDAELPARLQGRTIRRVERRGKYLLIFLQGGLVWGFHLGMSGKLIYVTGDTPRRKHDHIIVRLDDGGDLRYHDPRRFGLSFVVSRDRLWRLPQLACLGVDPFDGKFNGAYLYAITKRTNRKIRDLLLDQKVIGGIGNIYANEILFRAGIRPTRRSRRLSRVEVDAIAAASLTVLREAIRWCGTSFSDYRDADDKYGGFQHRLRVYDREGELCRRCPNLIKRVTLGNRSAFYCPSCQR
jgi:formamidopyrimidine-DNA glycosylase